MKKVQQRRLIRIVIIIVVIFMASNIVIEIFKTFKTSYEISKVKEENTELKQEEKNLKTEIAKLKDENYIQSYVSGTIFSTEKGTTVYVLPRNGEKAPE